MSTANPVYLRSPSREDAQPILEAYERSAELHQHWASPPADIQLFLADEHRYMVCSMESDEIVGTFHISSIVRGLFQSAFLGYNAFAPHAGKGYMREGIQLLITEAFSNLNLHRLEANIQPDNVASIALVSGAGFVKEGFSKNYLRVNGGDWKDHERWAILNPDWQDIT